MTVKCSHSGQSLTCKSNCKHAKYHSPHVYENGLDCRSKSKCIIIGKECQCIEKFVELIPD